MGNSLGDYNIERSSSSDIKNIKWTKKNPIDPDKSKNKKKKANKKFLTSATNIIHSQKTKEIKPSIEKVFKIENAIDVDKSKNKKKKIDKRFQNSSASNCNIEQGFKRPAR